MRTIGRTLDEAKNVASRDCCGSEMNLDHPIIGFIGAGAVGCYYGGRLAQHGGNVHLPLRSEYDRVSKNGLHVKSREGDFDLYPPALHVYRNVRDSRAAIWWSSP